MTQLLYAPFSKIETNEDGTLRVWGIASSEAQDSDGETIKADAMRAALPDYLTFGAVREMHQPIAAGTAIEASVDDDGITHFGAHIVDASSVKKVQAGVLKGFSIGGKITKRNAQDKTIIEGLKLTEISLVDRPANPDAVITLVKFDSAGKVVGNKKGTKSTASSATTTEQPMTKAEREELRKGMYDVRNFASIITDMQYLTQSAAMERDWEGDGSAIPNRLAACTRDMCILFREMVDEETAELLGLLGVGDDELLASAAKAVETSDLAKAGRKFSAASAKAIGDIHEAMIGACDKMEALGYKNNDNIEGEEMADKTASAEDLSKAHMEIGSLKKTDELQKAEIASLTERLTKSETEKGELSTKLTKAEGDFKELEEGVKAIVEQSVAKGVVRTVSKENDNGGELGKGAAADEKPTDALAEVRKAHQSPRAIVAPQTAAKS